MHLEYDTYVDPHTADALFSGIYLHPVGVKTLCVETVQAVKFPRMVRQATGPSTWPTSSAVRCARSRRLRVKRRSERRSRG